MSKGIYLYARFERFWHWAQAFLILGLLYTGLEIRRLVTWMDFETALSWHHGLAWSLVILTAFAVFWHLTTPAWKAYWPTTRLFRETAHYYLRGIFRGEPHPQDKQEMKLNPLQRLTYLGLKLVLFPVQIATGLMLYFNETWVLSQWGVSFETLASIHTLCSYLFAAFLIAHIYLATTGETPLAHIKAMFVGYELEHHHSSS